MKEVLLQEARGSHPDGHEKVLVTIFYPDATYGAQLVGAFHRAVAGLPEMEVLDTRPWRLDVLQWPEMQAEATRDIAKSRIVVVPADDAYASSEFFRRWVETWPAALDGQRLLLVPRRGAADIPPRVRQFVQWLEEICTQKGMDFTEAELAKVLTSSAQDQGVMDSRRVVSPLAPRQEQDRLATYVPEGEKPVERRFWGLNE
jgi:hypothetical protein